jgi:hydrogenase-4 component E
MTNVLLIVFTISLLYLGIATRLLTYIRIFAFQGLLLFGVSFIELTHITTLNLIFILLETIIFKTIAVPLFMSYVIKKNRITRDTEPYLPSFISLIIITIIIIIFFILSNAINASQISKIYFVVANSTLFAGLYIIITRRKIITQVMGFLIVENGVFILSLAIGNKMPMLLNTGILLDLFLSFLVLGIFINKIKDVFKEPDMQTLSQLRD